MRISKKLCQRMIKTAANSLEGIVTLELLADFFSDGMDVKACDDSGNVVGLVKTSTAPKYEDSRISLLEKSFSIPVSSSGKLHCVKFCCLKDEDFFLEMGAGDFTFSLPRYVSNGDSLTFIFGVDVSLPSCSVGYLPVFPDAQTWEESSLHRSNTIRGSDREQEY